MVYGLTVRHLLDKNRGYLSETHLISDSPQMLMDNWHVLFSHTETILNRGEWEQQEKNWFNNGIVTHDSWGDDWQWAVTIHPLHDIAEWLKLQEAQS